MLYTADASRRLKWSFLQIKRNSEELIHRTPFLLLMFIHQVAWWWWKIKFFLMSTFFTFVFSSSVLDSLIFPVLSYSRPGGGGSVQSQSCGLLGETWAILAAWEVFRGTVGVMQSYFVHISQLIVLFLIKIQDE